MSLSGTAQVAGSFLPAEKAILEILARDSTEQVVTVMPMSYRFGIRDLTFDRISILKDGSKILLLPDGQDAVYQWKPALGKLIRIDSSHLSGSNFGMMPFIRNGKAWQFGGYGFWRSRNLFTSFDESAGKWAFEFSDTSVTGHLTLYFYDAAADVFYMCGVYRNRPHEMHRTDFRNDVYRFNFRDLSWEHLGQVAFIENPAQKSGSNSMNVVHLDSGLMHIMASQTTFFDFKHNVLSRVKLGFDSAFLRVANLSGKYDRAWEHSIMLGDTAVIILANEHEVCINKLFIRSDMFEPIGQIWSDEAKRPVASSKIIFFAWALFGLFTIAACIYFLRRKSHFFKSLFRSNRLQENAYPMDHDINDWSVFWQGLRSAHQVLLRYMVLEGGSQHGVNSDAINQVLGVSRRAPGLQKVHRNRAIRTINQVYQQTFRNGGVLIHRSRDPKDRRQTLLSISENEMIQIRKHLGV